MALPSLSSLSSLGGLDFLQGLSKRQPAKTSENPFGSSTASKGNGKATPSGDESDLSSLLSGLDLGFLQGQSNAVQALSLNVESSRSEFAISGQGFAAKGYSENFSLDATLKLGDQMVSLNLQISRSSIGIATAGAVGQGGGDQNGFSLESLIDRLPDDAKALVKQYTDGGLPKDYFSPDNTANRIADFALSGFKLFEGGKASSENSADSRQRFADYILPAIDKGFADARKILGSLPQQITENIDQTRSLIGKRFEDFLGGLDTAA